MSEKKTKTEAIEPQEQAVVTQPETSENELDQELTFKPGSVVDMPISTEMKRNYLDYSMSVIVSRALPDSRDGLKPSQRRILVAMKDLGLYPTANYRKSAKISGVTSGDYHPHGDQIVYPTMVKLAQEFATRYPLVDGQGNFGTVDGDSPAAQRYTEARMTKVAELMLNDLDKGTVTFVDNYDGSKQEPTVLPTVYPNLLCNGADGIAVGMATRMPPHNLTEVVNALRAMIKKGNKWNGVAIYNELRLKREGGEAIPQTLNSKPASHYENYLDVEAEDYETERQLLLERVNKEGPKAERLYPEFETELTPSELMEYVPGPDFPTAGVIYDKNEILNAYSTGRGKILMRAVAEIEEGERNRMHIVVTEIPYQVNKANLITKIAGLVKDGKITGIADIRDESNKDGMRIVIILKTTAQPKTVLNKLYKFTPMQMSFSANMISLVDQEPELLSLKRMLELFLNFRFVVTVRRFEFDLAQARYRGHVLEGLLKALDMLDEVIACIRASKTQDDAKSNLMEQFGFTTVQAQAILDMQLRRLAALERDKLTAEFDEISAKIKDYNEKLADQGKILEVIDEDLALLVEKHGDERRTKVVAGKVDEFSEEDLVPNAETFVTISREGYIKRLAPDTFKTQKRGGKGIIGATTKEGDLIEHAFSCMTHDSLMLFTNKGRVFSAKVYEIGESSRTAKGIPLVNLIQLDQGELVTSVLTTGKKGVTEGVMGEDEIQEGQAKSHVVEPKDFKYLFMATSNGTVKKTALKNFDNIRSSGLVSINLDEGDELKWVRPTTGEDHIILVTAEGRSIRFKEEDVRATGRATRGVRGMKFKSDSDKLISMHAIRSDENQLFTLSENGFGKMTKLSEYPVQGRGGSGVFTFQVRDKTGNVAVARMMDHPDKEIVVISEKGIVIRSAIDAIPVLGRQTSGVKVMSMKKGDRVAAMAIL